MPVDGLMPMKEKMDRKVAKKLVTAWDEKRDAAEVLRIYLKYKDLLSSYRYWELMRSVWIISGGLETADIFRRLMKSTKPNKRNFMSVEDYDVYQKIDKITVYRACDQVHDGGMSWTTSEQYAWWYKERFNKKLVESKEVERKDIFAFIGRNAEYEVLLLK